MLSRMKLEDETIDVVVANDGQGLVTIDEFAQLMRNMWRVSSGY